MDCGTAVAERNEKPKTCYFEGTEQFVCCRVPRPSEIGLLSHVADPSVQLWKLLNIFFLI